MLRAGWWICRRCILRRPSASSAFGAADAALLSLCVRFWKFGGRRHIPLEHPCPPTSRLISVCFYPLSSYTSSLSQASPALRALCSFYYTSQSNNTLTPTEVHQLPEHLQREPDARSLTKPPKSPTLLRTALLPISTQLVLHRLSCIRSPD